jgi:uridine kinase
MAGDRTAGHVAAIVALVDSREARCGPTHLVAIDGPSGAGKTTLAARVAAELAAPTVHMDDLYPGWDGLRAATRRLESWVVEPLRAGHPARYRRWDWAAGEYAEWVQLPASEVIVVEGCGSGALPAGRALSALVWVDADEQVRKARGLARDPGYAPFWDRWAAQERELYAADGTKARADLVADTTHDRL